jgi:hypothetical protein
MSRLVAIAVALIAGAWTSASAAADTAPTPLLTWPGKTGAPAVAAPPAAAARDHVTLSRQFFGARDDMAAPPSPLMPRSVPGSQTVTSTASANTAANRARQTEILTADSASDGPVAGAENPN